MSKPLRVDLTTKSDGFELRLEGKVLFRHSQHRPWIEAGRGEAEYRMHRGNFKVEDRVFERRCLPEWSAEEDGAGGWKLAFWSEGGPRLEAKLSVRRARRVGPEDRGEKDAAASGQAGAPDWDAAPESLFLDFGPCPEGWNRWRFSLYAEPGEEVWGCGEQFSYFNLRGKAFPLWTSEQGVGRNKKTLITKAADLAEGAGGDYWWTFYPQPSYTTRRKLRVHAETTAWARFDFSGEDWFLLEFHALPSALVFGSAESYAELACQNARFFGLQPEPPSWVHEGVILGIQGGTRVCLDKLAAARAAGVPVVGIWAQDWEGVRYTSFGKRLAWNWEAEPALYPDLAGTCARLKAEGVRFLAYANCYLACDKPLFAEAEKLGVLVRDRSGAAYRFDAGEFDAGIPDLTNPAGREWFKNVIKRNILGLGISGWMADFGEYLPADCVLWDGTPAELAHNLWPVLWAKVNREALEEAGAVSEAIFFMRAGYSGTQRYCPLMWAGDQNVDWSADDGIPSVIPAALSLAMLGHGFHHSDLGGYTTLFFLKRSKELLLRWAELSAFTVMMRSHEGNRPASNHQFDSCPGTLAGLAAMGRLKAGMAPYFKMISAECARLGAPLLRPLFMEDEGDEESYGIKNQFMAGPDLLVAPVLRKGARTRRLRLIEGSWVHLWSGKEYSGRTWIEVEAPLGRPPAFYRRDSAFADCFRRAAASALR
ncbi:MAG TPA: alpha-glucosidase [Rectinemataceae bacterium]